jgi:hypothetical protein
MSEEVKKPPFVMPKVEVGDCVYHFLGNDHREAAIAWVQTVGDSHLNILVFPRGNARSSYRSGVRHRDDPLRQPTDERGFWTRRPGDEKLEADLARLLKLAESLGEKP